MKNPPHPGLLIRAELEERQVSITAFARCLRMSRQAIQRLVTGKAGISPSMAIKLEKVLGPGAHVWLGMQSSYDLAQAERSRSALTEGLVPLPNDPAAN